MKIQILFLFILFTSLTAIAQKDIEPELKRAFFTFRNGEEVTGEVNRSDKFIYLNIETAHAKGETIVLELDEDHDYLYKNKFLAKGSSIQFLVKKDIARAKLVIYNPSIKKHKRLKEKSKAQIKAADTPTEE